MNRLQRLLGIGAIALATITGCKEYRTEYSEIKHGNASVELHYHRPYMHVGGGRLFIRSHPAQYHVKFSGDVNFEINNKNIFNRFKDKSSLVDVSYREIYFSVYDDTDRDGQKELIKRKLQGYEFVDAQLKK